ncbi:MAG: hypothetical protein RIR70_69 [Pseudomonadota bacterium]|jgi:nicotinamidase-related amidase
MLIDRQHSMLLVVDMQTRLLPAIHDHQAVVEGVSWLIAAAKLMNVPVLATEQNPAGLGPTLPEIAALLPPRSQAIPGKLEFSCAAGRCFDGSASPERQQVVVCGIEAHVCVLQTAIELHARGRNVFVVADAIGSRKVADRDLALSRLAACGVYVVSREMVGFEWLRAAGSDEFRAFSKALLKST